MNWLGEFPCKQIHALLHRSRVAADAFKYFFQSLRCTGQSVKRQRVSLWSGSSEVRISGRSNRTQCCQWLAYAAIFLRRKLCCPGAMTRRWAPSTRFTLRRNTTSIMKDLIRCHHWLRRDQSVETYLHHPKLSSFLIM